MFKAIPKYTAIKGCTIYPLDANGHAADTPAAIDIDITLPEQSHPTTDVQMMGTISIPDPTRLDDLTVTVNINADSPEAQVLVGDGGVVGWQIQWVDEVIDQSGNMRLVGWTVTAKGYIGGVPEANKNQGSDNTGDLTMHAIYLRKANSDGVVPYEIDRVAGKLIRNGKDLREQINRLL